MFELQVVIDAESDDEDCIQDVILMLETVLGYMLNNVVIQSHTTNRTEPN